MGQPSLSAFYTWARLCDLDLLVYYSLLLVAHTRVSLLVELAAIATASDSDVLLSSKPCQPRVVESSAVFLLHVPP